MEGKESHIIPHVKCFIKTRCVSRHMSKDVFGHFGFQGQGQIPRGKVIVVMKDSKILFAQKVRNPPLMTATAIAIYV